MSCKNQRCLHRVVGTIMYVTCLFKLILPAIFHICIPVNRHMKFTGSYSIINPKHSPNATLTLDVYNTGRYPVNFILGVTKHRTARTAPKYGIYGRQTLFRQTLFRQTLFRQTLATVLSRRYRRWRAYEYRQDLMYLSMVICIFISFPLSVVLKCQRHFVMNLYVKSL